MRIKGVGEGDATRGCRVPIYKARAGLGRGPHVFCFLSIPLGSFLGMASCALCKKGLREQFVTQSNGGQ